LNKDRTGFGLACTNTRILLQLQAKQLRQLNKSHYFWADSYIYFFIF